MMEIAQAATEVVQAGKSSVSVFLDAGVIGLIITNSGLLIKALIDRKAVKKAKDKEGPGPGESRTCREHGESISALEEFKETAAQRLIGMDAKLDRLIERFIGKA